eukprot:6434346-Pyramimonas_sp.AAC.1
MLHIKVGAARHGWARSFSGCDFMFGRVRPFPSFSFLPAAKADCLKTAEAHVSKEEEEPMSRWIISHNCPLRVRFDPRAGLLSPYAELNSGQQFT